MQEQIKKSSLTAGNLYEYKKIMYPHAHFVDAQLEEDGEELIIRYDLEGMVSFREIRSADMSVRLSILMNVKELASCAQNYRFSMEPDNLYYDRNRLVYVKFRDIYGEGEAYSSEEWLVQYKALIGYALQKQYSYTDYLQGGMQLLKSGILGKIRQAESAEEIFQILEEKYNVIEEERKNKKILLNRKRYGFLRTASVVLLVLCVAGGTYILYDRVKTAPYKDAVIAAESAYIASDYIGCIDEMKQLSVTEMDIYQKYILANSYVRSENLTQEQKDNILKNLSLKENPTRLEYWIYMGRNDVDEAIDIAMQQSDDEMLLYAYMKQKSNIESDTSLSGEERTKQLEDVTGKMQPIMEKYEIEEE